MQARSLAVFVISFILSASALAQEIQFSPGFSWRAYNGTVTPPLCPDRLCHFYPTNSNDQYYTEFATWTSATNNPNSANGFLNFRVMFPAGYNINDNTKKYPVILFLHGAGESGRVWQGRFNYAQDDPLLDNNSRNLIHGGNEHRLAVQRNPADPNSFPGIVIFPQVSYSGSWSDSFNNGIPSTNQEFVIAFVEYIINQYHGDINKVAIQGLSNGAKGTWDTAMKRPDLFCAVQPFSGVPNDTDLASDILLTTPLRLYQGGLDANPSPGGAETIINSFKSKGANPEYFLYPTLGHNVWTTAMARPDFFTWIRAQDKRKIYVFGGSTGLCNEPGANKKLGFSAGFLKYQWTKNGVDLLNDTTRYLTTSEVGTYTVKFMRRDSLWYESFPTTITPQGSSTYSPPLSHTGSLILPYTLDNGSSIGSIGQTVTNLVAPSGFSEYTWYKDNNLLGTTTANIRQISSGVGSASDAGVYTVSLQENTGCESLISNSKTLVYIASGLHSSPTGGFTGLPIMTILSENKIRVTWTETFTNETHFEIWRYRRSANGYPLQDWKVVGQTSSNVTTFLDEESGLRPNAQYRYRVRAMTSSDGRYSGQTTNLPAYPVTQDDFKAPSVPTDLQVTNVTINSITVSWLPSTDNDVVHRYEVFLGATSVGFSQVNDISILSDRDQTDGNPAPSTSFTFTGLDPASTYLINVRAIDFRGNKSAFPEPLVATTSTPANGVSFNYYPPYLGNLPGAPNQLLTYNFSQTPQVTGVLSNFNISGAITYQNTPTPQRYVYSFDSYIQIDVAGTYTFWTRSDDGSRLYINGNSIVQNDNVHGAVNQNGTYNFPSPGKYPIRVTYFQGTGGQSLEVRYRSGIWSNASYNSASLIPNNKLWLTDITFTNYYSKASGDLNDPLTWGPNTDGSGSRPPNFSFTNNYQFFNIANRTDASVTLTSSWTVSGLSSRVILGNNITLTLDAAMTAKLYANAGSTINLNHATLPQFVELDPTSTVNMNVAGTSTIPAAVYGNLNLKTGATTKLLPANGASIKGNLVVDDQVTFLGTEINQSTLVAYGNITFSGTSGNPPVAKDRYSLVFKGSQQHTINITQNNLFLQGLEVDYGGALNFNSVPPFTINIGATSLSGGLLLRSGSTLQLGQSNLNIVGNYGVNPTDDIGEISINGGDVMISTGSVQTSNLYFTDESIVKNFSVSLSGSGQLNVLKKAQLKNLMTLSAGTANMFGEFILNSDATGTARIGPIGTGARINGNVTFQRFMEGEGQIYRYISSPVKGFRVADIQQYIPVTGTFTGSNGSGASMFHYHSTAYQNFPPTSGTNQDTLRRGKGYPIFVRQATAPTTWEATGNPHQGTIPFVLTPGTINPGDGWNLLGNPYPAPIKWTGAASGGWSVFQNISQTVYIRENFILNGVRQYRWQVYHPLVTPVGENFTPFDGIIAPGQAFWIQTTSAAPLLTITENAKFTEDRSFFRSADDDKKDVLNVTLKNGTGTISDVAYILYTNTATENYDKITDAVKSDNSLFNISTLSADNIALAINATPETFCDTQIRLNITNAVAGNYSLTFQGLDTFKRIVKMQLKDNFLGTLVDITAGFTYNFAITADAASKGSARFVIIEKPLLKNSVALATSPVCESDPTILIIDSQPGANYQAFFNGIPVSDKIRSIEDSTTLILDRKLLGIGTMPITLTTTFGDGCTDLIQTQLEKVQIDSLNTPDISLSSGLLITNILQADQYQWFLDGTVLKEETNNTITPVFAGVYEVEITARSCVKKSPGFTYSITAIDDVKKPVVGIYPNPFNDRLMITLDENDEVSSIITSNLMGQVLKNTPVAFGKREVELNLSDLPAGSYIIGVGIRKYKVIKQR